MKILTILMASLIMNANPAWLGNSDDAKMEATKEDKFILVSFSGSGWCIPCIRLEKQVFEAESFKDYASKNLVLVKADFPRLKKNKLSKEQTALNEQLAAKYNPHGKFPYTLLLDKAGKVVKEWDGLPNETNDQFIADINSFVHARE
jgi:thioredoxin-related protein